jgi:hypothetical protein
LLVRPWGSGIHISLASKASMPFAEHNLTCQFKVNVHFAIFSDTSAEYDLFLG